MAPASSQAAAAEPTREEDFKAEPEDKKNYDTKIKDGLKTIYKGRAVFD